MNLEELNDRIKYAEIQALELAEKIEDAKEQTELIQLETADNVASEQDLITNKPLFSNPAKRRAEIKVRLGKNEIFTKTLKLLKNSKHSLEMMKINLSHQKRLFQARLIIEKVV
ncbi:hypothetical protein LCGC14_1728690 [marine sediment metagenome]|uniref:Uncharacterized protein n=1 Tax=marine sediment metagenome TaxID=412755 RepID=A0A0F9HA14_9ZZZZ